jgi:tetratricopeptide (TPR) repeat protein
MNPGRARRPLQRRYARFAAIAALALVVYSSCASTSTKSSGAAPATNAAATNRTASGAASATANPASAGTVLKTAKPAVLAKAKAERDALEARIAFGSPDALRSARRMLESMKSLRPEERHDLGTLIDDIESLVYPDTRPGASAGSAGSGGSAAPAGSAGSAAVAPGSQPSGSASTPPPSVFAPDLHLFAAAAAGLTLSPPVEVAGTALGELIPALAMFAADSREAARQAQNAFDRFAQLRVPSIIPDLALGIDAERRLDWKVALERYRRVLDAAPDAWPAVIGLGRALLALGRPVSALAILEPSAAKLDAVPRFLSVYGQALYENARFAEAAGYIARALVGDPQNSRLILIRAYLLVRDKAYQQAIPLLDAYGTVDPANRLYLLLRCLAAEGMRSREEALRWARQGLSLYPNDPELLVAASRLIYEGPSTGRDEAHSLAARAYELTTPNIESAAGPSGAGQANSEQSPLLAAARKAAGFEAARLLTIDAAAHYQWDLAAVYLSRATALGAFQDRALAAAVLRKSGDWAATLAYAETWHRERPDSNDATEAYLRALIGSGNDKAAQELIARLLPGATSPPFRSVLYFLQSRIQKSDEAALSLLRSALIENADNPEALAAMYDILYRRKDLNRARFYLKQALTLDPGNPDLLRRQAELDGTSTR